MKRKSIRITLTLIASIALFSIIGMACTDEISAQSGKDDESEYPLLVERFAKRFDLDPDEIMEFLGELKEEKIIKAEEKFEERLDELVEDEKITEDQKEAILAKKGELAEFREELKDMTLAEAKESIKDMHEDLKEWAEDNDLELRHFFPKPQSRHIFPRWFRHF